MTWKSAVVSGIDMADLHLAARNGDADKVRALIRGGQPHNDPILLGETPLHWAAQNGQTEIVHLLLSEHRTNHDRQRDKYGNTALHKASYFGHWNTVQLLASIHRANVNDKNKGGVTPLHWAALRGHTQVCKLLIELGADMDVRSQVTGETPLHKAVRAGHKSTVTALIGLGADITLVTRNIKSASDLAAEHGYQDMIELLAQAAAGLVEINKVHGFGDFLDDDDVTSRSSNRTSRTGRSGRTARSARSYRSTYHSPHKSRTPRDTDSPLTSRTVSKTPLVSGSQTARELSRQTTKTPTGKMPTRTRTNSSR